MFLYNKQNNTWMCGNMKLFRVLTRISHSFVLLTREISWSTLEIKFIFPHIHVSFSLYYQHYHYFHVPSSSLLSPSLSPLSSSRNYPHHVYCFILELWFLKNKFPCSAYFILLKVAFTGSSEIPLIKQFCWALK